jgi:hypothetical protein
MLTSYVPAGAEITVPEFGMLSATFSIVAKLADGGFVVADGYDRMALQSYNSAGVPTSPPINAGIAGYFRSSVRIPTKPASNSNTEAGHDSDLKPARVPI